MKGLDNDNVLSICRCNQCYRTSEVEVLIEEKPNISRHL
jgi:hypothetical protein